jgi:hypothetical protein
MYPIAAGTGVPCCARKRIILSCLKIKMAPMRFNLQPTLENEFVKIRPLTVDDFDALFAIASDPLVWEQ